jgi:group II intron reverse transcriptase/maturase
VGTPKGRETYGVGTPVVVKLQADEGAGPEGGREHRTDSTVQGRYRRELVGRKACEMQATDTILGLIRERGRKGLPMERVMHQMYNSNLYVSAYAKLYKNQGAMTPGITAETPDGMSLAKIDTIITTIRNGTFQWKPARRVYIPKKNSEKKRPLGLPTWTDKLVQEVIRMLLDAYYEPQFSDSSCGFRPGRGCHTALGKILHQWPGTVWFIEGDIAQCFDKLDHQVLLDILSESIHDKPFIRFIGELLKAGYLEDWRFNATLSGTPQGGVVSPILSNIYLDRLDKYVTGTLIPANTKGKIRKWSPQYQRLAMREQKLRKQERRKEAQAIKDQMRQIPAVDFTDPNFRRLRYVRYADDFLLGFIGPKSEAEAIKAQLEVFLRDSLKLELSLAKTLVTHARTERAKFLGYEVHVHQENTKRVQVHSKNGYTYTKRSVNGRIGLRVPERVVKEKSQPYLKQGKATHRKELATLSEYEIVSQYQSEYRGLVEYYRMAYNLSTELSTLGWLMETSLTKTLASKLKVSVSQVYRRFRTTLTKDGKPSRGLQVIQQREGKRPLVAIWGGIPLKWNANATLNDQPPKLWVTYSELAERLLIGECEWCGSGPVEGHHIHALKDIGKAHPGRDKPEWVKLMIARQRKVMFLCRTCHEDVTFGRPMRNARSGKGFMQDPKAWYKSRKRTDN